MKPDKPDLVVEHSGRDVWWEVRTTAAGHNIASVIIGPELDEVIHTPGWLGLDKYIVDRAAAGCGDCAAAILECPWDLSLMGWLEKAS